MKLDSYNVTLKDGQTFIMLANMAEASAPIQFCVFEGEEPQSTPYQTAHADYSEDKAASILANYFMDGPDDCAEVESVELADDKAE